jgi:hypothetical protein
MVNEQASRLQKGQGMRLVGVGILAAALLGACGVGVGEVPSRVRGQQAQALSVPELEVAPVDDDPAEPLEAPAPVTEPDPGSVQLPQDPIPVFEVPRPHPGDGLPLPLPAPAPVTSLPSVGIGGR